MSTSETHHAELYILQAKLRDILKSVSSFRPSIARPPIIDSSFDISGNPDEDIQHQDAVKGLRSFRDSVKRDLDVLEKVRRCVLMRILRFILTECSLVVPR